MFRIRIIPLTIATALLLMIVKVVDVVRGTQEVSGGLLISQVEAQSNADAQKVTPAKEEAAKEEKPKADAKTEENSAEKKADKDEKKEEGKNAKKDEGKGDANKEEAKKGDGKEEKKEEEQANAEDKKKKPKVTNDPGPTVDRRYNAVEMELLENLAKRRDELDRWDRNIEIKEEALNATEKRIDEKITQIDAMKKEVSGLLALYNEKEDAKIRSLVKIYENMKPGDAARIFDEVEMPILLIVIDKMSEKKAAPILAEMNPKKAKQITVELAELRRVSSARLNATGLPVAPVR